MITPEQQLLTLKEAIFDREETKKLGAEKQFLRYFWNRRIAHLCDIAVIRYGVEYRELVRRMPRLAGKVWFVFLHEDEKEKLVDSYLAKQLRRDIEDAMKREKWVDWKQHLRGDFADKIREEHEEAVRRARAKREQKEEEPQEWISGEQWLQLKKGRRRQLPPDAHNWNGLQRIGEAKEDWSKEKHG